MIFYGFLPLVSDHLTHSLMSMFAVRCAALNIRRILVTKWKYTWCSLEIACNKLSSVKQMCPDRFSEKAPCGSILVSGPLSRCILGGRLREVRLYKENCGIWKNGYEEGKLKERWKWMKGRMEKWIRKGLREKEDRRKGLKEKRQFWKEEEEKEKGWKSKGRKDRKDQSRPWRKVWNHGSEIGGRKGEYQDRGCKL